MHRWDCRLVLRGSGTRSPLLTSNFSLIQSWFGLCPQSDEVTDRDLERLIAARSTPASVSALHDVCSASLGSLPISLCERWQRASLVGGRWTPAASGRAVHPPRCPGGVSPTARTSVSRSGQAQRPVSTSGNPGMGPGSHRSQLGLLRPRAAMHRSVPLTRARRTPTVTLP